MENIFCEYCCALDHTTMDHVLSKFKGEINYPEQNQKVTYYNEPEKELCTKCLKDDHISIYCDIYCKTIHLGYDYFYSQVESKKYYNILKEDNLYKQRIENFRNWNIYQKVHFLIKNNYSHYELMDTFYEILNKEFTPAEIKIAYTVKYRI